MNTSSKLVLLVVTVFLLTSLSEVECRRTYSSRSSSSGRGNRGKNQPSSGGLFSSWFGGGKSSGSSSGSGSGSIAKPAPTSAKKNWQTASSHAASQPKSSSNWANPYYKPPGSAQVPSAPKEPSYGWKPTGGSNAKPVGSYPSSNIGARGYPVQTGVQQQGSQAASGGFKSASGSQPSQTNFGGYRPASNVPNTHGTGSHPSMHQNNYGGYHSATNLHPSQPSHGYQPSLSHQPSYHPSGAHSVGAYPHQAPGFSNYHPSYTGYSPHASFAGAVPSYQGNKLFGGSSGHYGYPGSGSWGINTYGSRKSSGTGKLLTGLAVGAAGGYLTSSLVNRISNPWKYGGYGYGSGFGYGSGYGSGYDYGTRRDESAFERGFERGLQSRQQNENVNTKETAAPPPPEEPTSKWIQCVAFDPQTQQTLINPNCSCTVTTSLDERTGQPLSVHHCTTLNGLVMQPVPIQPYQGKTLPPPSHPPIGQPLGGPDAAGAADAAEAVPFYGGAYQGEFHYTGGPTIYLPPKTEPKLDRVEDRPELDQIAKEAIALNKTLTETKSELATTESRREQITASSKPEDATNIVPTSEKVTDTEPAQGETTGGVPPVSEKLAGGLQDNHKRTSEFYGQLQKIVNMGNFVDGG